MRQIKTLIAAGFILGVVAAIASLDSKVGPICPYCETRTFLEKHRDGDIAECPNCGKRYAFDVNGLLTFSGEKNDSTGTKGTTTPTE